MQHAKFCQTFKHKCSEPVLKQLSRSCIDNNQRSSVQKNSGQIRCTASQTEHISQSAPRGGDRWRCCKQHEGQQMKASLNM